MKDEWKSWLEKAGFEEKQKEQWIKQVDDDLVFYWDFRKIKHGRAYVSKKGGGFLDAKDVNSYMDYINFRDVQSKDDKTGDVKKVKQSVEVVDKSENGHSFDKSVDVVLRGNENDITRVVKSRRLDIIAKASKDGIGEGILYHNLGSKIGYEPSAQLIDMIAADMGNIETEVVEHGIHNHVDIDSGDQFQTYYAIVKATDRSTGTSGIGVAEQVIDYGEMKNNGRCFSLTLCIRKAGRNAVERLIPVPRSALVELIKSIMLSNKKD
jgi:hypothetical protein